MSPATDLTYVSAAGAMADGKVYLVTVPSPINLSKRPDITLLTRASETISRML